MMSSCVSPFFLGVDILVLFFETLSTIAYTPACFDEYRLAASYGTGYSVVGERNPKPPKEDTFYEPYIVA